MINQSEEKDVFQEATHSQPTSNTTVPLSGTPMPQQKQEAGQGTPATANKEKEMTPVKKPGRLRQVINSPWLLLTAPLLAGCIWLINNSWIITNNLNKPYALLAGPALVASILLGWLVITFFRTIASWCARGWNAFQRARKEDGSAQFFWIVIIVFMVVSVFSSGAFFTTIEHNALPGLGYATALFIDLVAVQAMRARLNAVRMRNTSLARLYLFGVLLCAGASAFANVYTSLADFNQHITGQLPPWMLNVAPWFGLVFPAMILLLSITADATIDQVSTRLDPESYREQQAKQTKMLEYQRDALRSQLAFEQEIDKLSAQLQNRKERRVFFLYDWVFPIRQRKQDIDTHKLVEDAVEDAVEQTLEKMLNQIRPWFDFLDNKFEQAVLALQTTQGSSEKMLQKNIATLNADLELVISQLLKLQQFAEQQANSSQIAQMNTAISQNSKEMAATSAKRRKNIARNQKSEEQLSQKFLNFKPNAFHEKAAEILRYMPEFAAISAKIRAYPREGYEALATLFRGYSELNFAFVTGQFAAEVWSLFQLEQDGEDGHQTEKAVASPSPDSQKRGQKTSQKQEGTTARSEAENRVNTPDKQGGYAVPFMQPASEGRQAVGEGEQPADEGQTALEQATNQSNVETVIGEEDALPDGGDQESQRPEKDSFSDPQDEQNTEEIHLQFEDISSAISSKLETPKELNFQNSQENPSEQDAEFSKFAESEDEGEQKSEDNVKISQSASKEFSKFADEEQDSIQISPSLSRKISAHGPHTMTISEVADNFETTTAVIEEAIKNGQLILSKRTKNGESKILVSSLERFSPPRKRGRRPTRKLAEAEAVL